MITRTVIRDNRRLTSLGIFGIRGSSVPRAGLLVYQPIPKSDNLIIPEDEIYDESTIDIGFTATPRPGVTVEQVMSAVSHTSGVASYWYDTGDEPITRLAVGFGSLAGEGISELAGINTANILFKLINADTQSGVLAIYSPAVTAEILTKAKRALKIT